MSSSITIMKLIASLAALIALLCGCLPLLEAKILYRQPSRYYDDGFEGGPYAGATGERAILTVRGARNPYDGSAPSKLMIEDNPYRGPYPRGVYDRLDSGYGRRPRNDYYNGGYSNYNGGSYGGYNGGYGSMYGAPGRIAVTGAFPLGYGSRYAK